MLNCAGCCPLKPGMNEARLTSTRAALVRVARSYLKTPFEHLGRQPHRGLDCAGLLICAARETGIWKPDFDVNGYSRPITYEHRGTEAWETRAAMIRECLDRYFVRIELEAIQPGDVAVLFTGRMPVHMGLVAERGQDGSLSVVHAHHIIGVQESPVTAHYADRHALAFSYPGLEH